MNRELDVCSRCLDEAEIKVREILSTKNINPSAMFAISEALSFVLKAQVSIRDAQRRIDSVEG